MPSVLPPCSSDLQPLSTPHLSTLHPHSQGSRNPVLAQEASTSACSLSISAVFLLQTSQGLDTCWLPECTCGIMGGRGGSCGPRRVKYSSYHGSTLLWSWGPGSASLAASGHPGSKWSALAHSPCCTAPPPNPGGNCLGTHRTATGKARLANGRAELPAELATLPGGSKANLGAPCWSSPATNEPCSCPYSPKQ